MTQLSINNGMSKYSLVPILSYAAMLCTNKNVKNIEKGTKLGRIVMNELSQRFDPSSDQKAKLVWHYYALIGFYSESLQICREGSKAGVSSTCDYGLLLFEVHYLIANHYCNYLV